MDSNFGHVKLLDTLRPFSQELGRQRLALRRKLLVMVGAGIFTSLLLAFYASENPRYRKFRPLFAPIPALVSIYAARRQTAAYLDSYKARVFTAATSATFPTLRYDPFGSMPASVYAQCDLFERRPDVYDGQDLFVGTINGVKVAFSEVHAKAKARDARGKVRHVTLFNGVLFQAEFSRQLWNVTTVVPAVQFNAAHLARPFMNLKRERQPVANGEFEKHFHVYSSDAGEAQSIFTSAFMDRMTAMLHQFERRQLRVSFIGNRVTVAAAYGKGRFVPGLWTSEGDMDNMHFFIQQISGFAAVVDMLKKSKQFWTHMPAA